VEFFMRTNAVIAVTFFVLSGSLVAQETKPVPKDSVRVTVSGCTKGYVFTAGPSIPDQPESLGIPEGMHLRMNGPKKMIAAINAYKGSMVAITGLMKKGQYQDGVGIGGGVRIMPGAAPTDGNLPGNLMARPSQIDVEGWSPVVGRCASR
jgi:hypothetical protein